MSMLKKYDNALYNFGLYVDEKFKLKEQNIKKDHRNLVDKSLDVKIYTKNCLSGCISQNQVLATKSLLSLREVSFSKQEFFVDIPIPDIKYHYPNTKNNNLFYLLND